MSGPTANLPVGLLDGLGIKSGAYPRTLLEDIRPTLDLLELVAINNAFEILTGTVAVASLSGGARTIAALTVPQGETWLVQGFNVNCTTGAAELCVIQAAIFGGPNASVPLRVWNISGADLGGAAAIMSPLSASDAPFWSSSGQALGFWLFRSVTAATITVGLTASILRCRR